MDSLPIKTKEYMQYNGILYIMTLCLMGAAIRWLLSYVKRLRCDKDEYWEIYVAMGLTVICLMVTPVITYQAVKLIVAPRVYVQEAENKLYIPKQNNN